MNDQNEAASHGIRRTLLALSGAALLTLAAQAGAADSRKAVTVDDFDTIEVTAQLTANDARRRAYRYLASLGYTNNSSIGGARVRGITREGDTWIARVAYSSGSRVLSRKAVLYIDAHTAFVSEQQPSDIEGRVAAQ